jgi:cell wall-associated NlpC family hydrolase
MPDRPAADIRLVTRRSLVLLALPVLGLALAATAPAAPSKDAAAWAKPQIQRVVRAGFMADGVASFRGADPLDQAALQSIVEGLNALFAEQAAPAPEPWPPLPTTSTATATTSATTTSAAAPWPLSRWKATSPAQAVTLAEFDRVLVNALGLANAARRVRVELQRIGLRPPARAGTETVARLLGLRLNHPAGQDDLELRPDDPITRAEAAYSLAQVLDWDAGRRDGYDRLSEAFALPDPTPWQQRILTAAVSYVGYPYVWGGTDPARGFDCSGFVWRVYKLTAYADGGPLADTLRGRTTYELSGEVPARQRIAKVESLEPGDVLFFGKGPRSKPAQIDHTGIYLGNGWMVHSSGNGTTIAPFDGWYRTSFAWARRPLREAGLA